MPFPEARAGAAQADYATTAATNDLECELFDRRCFVEYKTLWGCS